MKNRLILSAVLICILTVCIALVSCSNPAGGGGGTHTVKFEITGPQTIADIVVYTNETGNFDQLSNVPIPWEKTITVQGRKGLFCDATIFSAVDSGLTYTAKIFVDGREIASSNSSTGSISVSGST